MIFDFNVSYDNVGFAARAERAAICLLSVPAAFINAISSFAKLFFMALGAALTFGQSKLINQNVILAAKTYAHSGAVYGLSLVGVFAPVNAEKWLTDVTFTYLQSL